MYNPPILHALSYVVTMLVILHRLIIWIFKKTTLGLDSRINLSLEYIYIYIYIYIREFQPMASAPDDALSHQTKTPIGFWCRWRLNSRSLIQ